MCGEQSCIVCTQTYPLSVFSLLPMVGRRLALPLTCILYWVMVATGGINGKNTMHECVKGYEISRVVIGSGGECKYDGD